MVAAWVACRTMDQCTGYNSIVGVATVIVCSCTEGVPHRTRRGCWRSFIQLHHGLHPSLNLL